MTTTTTTMNYCKGFTKKGTCCTRRAHTDGGNADADGLCKTHLNMVLEECSICLDKMFVKQDLTCGHSFCKNCIYKWDGETCPMCRKEMKFITHDKDIIITHLQKEIRRIDEYVDNKTIHLHIITLGNVIHTMLQNVWIQYYDEFFIDMLTEFIDIGMKFNKAKFRSHSNVLKSLLSRPSAMISCTCNHHHDDDDDDDDR